MEYLQPIRADFEGECRCADAVSWNRFLTTLKRHRRARLTLGAELRCLGRTVGRFGGAFVALGTTLAEPDPPEL